MDEEGEKRRLRINNVETREGFAANSQRRPEAAVQARDAVVHPAIGVNNEAMLAATDALDEVGLEVFGEAFRTRPRQ